MIGVLATFFCSAISKTVKGNKEDFLEKKITKLLDDKYEFRTRVGLVLLKCCYIEPAYLKYIFAEADRLSDRGEYYAKNGISVAHLGMFYQVPHRDDGLSTIKQNASLDLQ